MAAEIDYILLEWTYTPKDFFEQAITVERGAYTFRIDDGKVEVRLAPEYFDEAENRSQAIHADLENFFFGAQLSNSRPFQISSAPAISKVYRDGSKDVFSLPFILPAAFRFARCASPKVLEFRSVAAMACDDAIIPLQARIAKVTGDSDLEDVYNRRFPFHPQSGAESPASPLNHRENPLFPLERLFY